MVNKRIRKQVDKLIALKLNSRRRSAVTKKRITTGPSREKKKYEDEKYFSSTSSDRLPSYEGVTEPKAMPKQSGSQYSRSNSNIITPSKTAIDDLITGISLNQLTPEERNIIEELLTNWRKQICDINLLENKVAMLCQAVEELKIPYGCCIKPLQSVVKVNSKEQTLPIAPSLTAYNELQSSSSQPNQSLGESQQNDNNIGEDEEFNTSDDNVLITNKYSNIGVKPVPHNEAVEQEWIPIGSGMTLIHRDDYESINWKSYTTATRTLLMAVFNSRILATHSLTGKPSPAFQDKPAKLKLDETKISDVITEVTDRFRVRVNVVRSVITTKCADECKMWKMRCKKNVSKRSKREKPCNLSSDTFISSTPTPTTGKDKK